MSLKRKINKQTGQFAYVMNSIMAVVLTGLIFLSVSCRSSSKRNSKQESPEVQKEELIKNQQMIVKDENTDIEDYVARRNYKMTQTQTGLRYYIYKKGEGTIPVEDDKTVTIQYDVSLLDGTKIYSSDSTGDLRFKVGKADIASGLQEGVKYLHEGDHAVFILPSHLAYGLSGDGDRIKQYEVLVINVKLLKVTD